VVVLCDAERPADHPALRTSVLEGHLFDRGRWNTGLCFRPLEGVGLNAPSELLVTGGCSLDELFVGQPGVDDLPRHRVRQPYVATDVDPEPYIGRTGGARAARIDGNQPRTVAHAAQQVMEKDRVGLACVRTPQD